MVPNPGIAQGTGFAGTLVPIQNLFNDLESGDSIDLFLADSPSVTRELTSIDVVYPGETTFALAPKVRAVGLARLIEDIAPLR